MDNLVLDLDFVVLMSVMAYSPASLEQVAETIRVTTHQEFSEGSVMVRFMVLRDRGWIAAVEGDRLLKGAVLTDLGKEILLESARTLHRLSSIVIAQMVDFALVTNQ